MARGLDARMSLWAIAATCLLFSFVCAVPSPLMSEDDTTGTTQAGAAGGLVARTHALEKDLVRLKEFDVGSVGDIKTSIASELPGWIRCDGKSIGNQGSGADYQGNDYLDLYDLIWSLPGLSTSPESSFVLSRVKGDAALADWDAGKTITIDLRDRYAIGKGPSDSIGSQVGSNHGHYHRYGPGSDISISVNDHTHPYTPKEKVHEEHQNVLGTTPNVPHRGYRWSKDDEPLKHTVELNKEILKIGKCTGGFDGNDDGSNRPLSVVINYFIKY